MRMMISAADMKARFTLWWGRGVNAVFAALCGAAVALGMLTFPDPLELCARGDGIVFLLALVLFLLVTASGIFEQTARAPKALFIAGQIVTVLLCAYEETSSLLFLLYPPLTLLLILGARIRGARFAVLPLTVMVVFGFGVAPGRHSPSKQYNPDFPESLYLPTSLMMERADGRILAASGQLDTDIWRELPYVAEIDQLWVRHTVDAPRLSVFAAARRLLIHGVSPDVDMVTGEYDIVVARFPGIFNMIIGHFSLRRGYYRYLVRHLRSDGVLVLASGQQRYLPPGDWRFAALPGGKGLWFAARRGSAPNVDPEYLDRHLQTLSAGVSPDDRILLPGAFAAMYQLPEFTATAVPPPAAPPPCRGRWFWLAGAVVLWFAVRLPLCRKAATGVAVTAAETVAAMVLFTCLAVPVWCENTVGTVVPASGLCAGVGLLLLPFRDSVRRRRCWLIAGVCFGMLSVSPWGGLWFWLIPFGWLVWFLGGAAVFSELRNEDHRAAFRGAAAGAAAGGVSILLAQRFGFDDPSIAVFSCALLLPAWLRR